MFEGQGLGYLPTLVLPDDHHGEGHVSPGEAITRKRWKLPSDRSLYVWNSAPPALGYFSRRCEIAGNWPRFRPMPKSRVTRTQRCGVHSFRRSLD